MDADLLLATCRAFADGEPGHHHLDQALAERGVVARWVCWDDPDVDWEHALVAVRGTWLRPRRLGRSGARTFALGGGEC